MDPSGPAHPGPDTAYNTAGNPVDRNQQEQNDAEANAQSNHGRMVEARERGQVPVPSTHDGQGTSSSLGRGVRDASGDKNGPFGTSNTDADQMRAPGEGEIAEAQDHKTGFGEQHDLASDLDRKKAEQAGARADMKFQRAAGVGVGVGVGVDVGEVVGDRGGPAAVEGR